MCSFLLLMTDHHCAEKSPPEVPWSLGPLGCVQPWTLQALVRRRDDLGQLLQAQMPRGLGAPRMKRGFLHQEHMLKNMFQS